MNRASRSSCRLEYDETALAWLYLDDQGSTNTISLPVLHDLDGALDDLAGRHDLKGLVVLSSKDAGFVSAPSVEELERLSDADHVQEYVEKGQSLMDRIAALPVPTVAQIHGHCLGSGLELALACRYRVADQTGSALGFPDVRLGVHPCHGGTARLPSLIGDWRALELLRHGGSVDGPTAARSGLVDAAVPGNALMDTARDLIARDPGRHRPGFWNAVFRARLVRWVVYKLLDYELQRKPCPEKYFVTYRILRLWRNHAGGRMAARLKAERESLLDLVRQPGARNLARTYLLQHRLQAEASTPDTGVLRRVHVVGTGTIGGGLAALLALHGREIMLHDADEQALRAAESRIQSFLDRHLEDPDELATARERVHVAGSGEPITDAGIAIEAIDEDMDAKQKLLSELESGLAHDAVLATTTSTLLIDDLAGRLKDPGRLIGLHCFDPVPRQPLIEVVAGQHSGGEALAAARALVTATQKLPLDVRGTPGFLVMRLQLAYILAAADMYERPQRELIDLAGVKFGMPHGPLELADAMGLDVCQRLAQTLGYTVPEALRGRVETGRLGKKTGEGFHNWFKGGRLTTGIPPGKHSYKAVGRQLIEPLLREAERCRDERVVADADLVDLGALFGVGFPAHTGGPLNLLKERGWDT